MLRRTLARLDGKLLLFKMKKETIAGSSYPNATGNPQAAAHNMQVEQSANMIIIALAHAQATGDGSLLSLYARMLFLRALFRPADSQLPSTIN